MERRRVAGKLYGGLVFAALLVPSAWLAWSFRDMPQLGSRHDDALYWVCAKALAEGRGYRILSLPAEPYQTKYPPLYPWLLSWIWRLDPGFPENLRWAALVAWLPLPLWLWLSRRFFLRCGFSSGAAWVLTALVALNPYTLMYSLVLMTEIPFGCALLGISLLLEGREGERTGAKRAAMAGALAAATYLMRTAALPWLVAGPLWLGLRRRYREAAVFAALMLPAIAGWAWWVSAHATPARDEISLYYTNYLGYHLANFGLSDLPLLLRVNAVGLVEGAGGLLALLSPSLLGRLVWWVLATGCFWGLVGSEEGRGGLSLKLFGALYAGILSVWHLTENDRYERLLLPLLPIIVAGLITTVSRILKLMERECQRSALGIIICVLIAIGLLVFVVRPLGSSVVAGPQHIRSLFLSIRSDLPNRAAAFNWIRAHLSSDATILSSDDGVVYLYTDRRGANFQVPPRYLVRRDAAAIQRAVYALPEFARRHGLGYIYLPVSNRPALSVHDQESSLYAMLARIYATLPEMLARDSRLSLIHRSGAFVLYRVSR